MEIKRKLPWIITGKSILAVGSIAMVALALVTYTATVTIQFNAFFAQGLTSTTWQMTTSSGSRYLPGKNFTFGLNTPLAPSASNSSSFAFYSKTGTGYVSVALAAAESASNFNTFKIFVLSWTGSAWANVTLFTDTTFTTTLPNGIDGITGSLTGYVHVTSTAQTFYAIQVNYALAPSPGAGLTSTFNEIPSLN